MGAPEETGLNRTAAIQSCEAFATLRAAPQGIGFSYDSSDRIIGVYDFTGRAWAMEYDLARRLVKVTAPPISGATGPSTTFEYAPDVNGTPSPALAKKRDANNAVVYSNTYDAQNRVIAQVWGGHTATLSFATNAGFNETTYTQFDGTVILYKFTAAGELVEERLFTRGVRSNEPTYYARTYVFGTNGLHSQVVHPSGLVEEYEYDARGNVTTSRSRPSLLSTSSIETHATYSSNFNQVLTSTDELGNVTSYTYDTHGNLLRVDYPTVTVPATQAAHVEFTYNSHGQMTQSLDEEGRKTTYAYAQSGPSVGFLVETRHEVSAGVDEVYSVSVDALGRIAAETTPWGATSTRTFNKWDLVTTATSPSGATTTFSYDGNGRPLSIVRPNRRVDGSAAPGAATYTTTFEHEVRGYVTKARSEFASGQYAEVTHTYSPLGYVATTTDPNGKVTRNDYDERGFLWKVRRGYGSSDEISTTQDYDLDGRLVKTVDPRGNATSLTYDEYGRVVKMAGSGQGYVTTSWNARGDVTSSAFYDTMGTASTSDDQVVGLVNFLVDERARIYGLDRRITGNTYAQTRLYLDKSGRLTQSVSPSGQSSTMEYDGAGRLVATRDALQNKAARQIANGRVVSEMAYDRVNGTDVLVAQSTLGYDTEGNLSTVTQLPVGGASGAPSRVSSTSYDVDGRPLVAVDPLGHETRFAYDGLGRLLSRTRPHNTSNLTETYAYDAGGRMVSRTDSAGESVSFAYDHLNRRTSATYPGSKVETFVHDENGNLTRWTDRNGTVVQQAFDSINRLTGRTMTLASGVLGATSESYTYDSVDRLLTASNNAGSGHSTSRTYDWRGALTSETQDSRTMTYGYDLDGARTSRTSPSGRALAYGRDALKRLTSISGTSPTSSTLLTNTWTGAGRKTAGSFGNGVSWTRTYDAYLRPTSEVHALSGTALFGRTYEYDLANNSVGLNETLSELGLQRV